MHETAMRTRRGRVGNLKDEKVPRRLRGDPKSEMGARESSGASALGASNKRHEDMTGTEKRRHRKARTEERWKNQNEENAKAFHRRKFN